MLLSDYNNQIRERVHDLASVDWADSELTSFINNARKQVALDSHCVRQFIVGANLIANQERYPFTGAVCGWTITNPGANYVTPVASVSGGSFVTAATAIATQTGGLITSILPTSWGTGYTVAPTISITDSGGPGAGATASPVMLLNVIDVVSNTIIWPGGGQSWTLNWSPFSEFQAWCRAYRQMIGPPVEWSQIQELQTMFFCRVPDQGYGLELDVVTLPVPLVNMTDVDVSVVDPWADAVAWYGCYLAMIKLQNYGHADYFDKKYKARLKEVVATKQPRRIRTPYMAIYRRRMRGG